MWHMEFSDIDEANEFTSDLETPVVLNTDKQKFHFRGRSLQADKLLIFASASATGYHARCIGALDDFVFAVQRKTLDLEESSPISADRVPTTILVDRRASEGKFIEPMSSQKGMIIEARTLKKALSDRLGHEHVARIAFEPDGMPLPIHLACESICDTLHRGLAEHGGLVDNPLAVANLQDALINTILYGSRHSYSAALRHGSVELPRLLRNAIEYIHANAHLPITPAEVAVASGLSIRSLQLTFREQLETTPQLYIRKVRLQRAYNDLKTGCGLYHLRWH